MNKAFSIPVLDRAAMLAVASHLDRKTKPVGSLGRLEELAIHLAGMTGSASSFKRKIVLVAAGDHGVAAQGVSAYPAEVTPQMVMNFLKGGAAINVLARHSGAKVRVVDAGVRGVPFAPHPDLMDFKIGQGTADMTLGPAMTHEQAERCLEVGRLAVERLVAEGLDMLATGDMGIGNTTASSAIAAAVLKMPVKEMTGRGTGIDATAWERKVAVIDLALSVNAPDPKDPIDILAKVGGFEIGVLAGVMLEASRRRIPIVLDGFISGAAAILAVLVNRECRHFMLASHQSVEIGHRHVLEYLGLRPYLNLDLRLGEGSGAAICFHLVDAASAILDEMETFESAGVSERE
ncbi:MAG: nicotinate-nucleotide--dimethylbenzimidazole phosphoribosyltransferase [candidate division FCPU426 bacterium]